MQVECTVEIALMQMIFLRLMEMRDRRAPLRPLVVLDDAALTPALNPIASVLYCSPYNYHDASWGVSHLAERSYASVNI